MSVSLADSRLIARMRSSSPPIAFDIDGDSLQLRFSLRRGSEPTDVLIDTSSPAVVIRVMADPSSGTLAGDAKVRRGEALFVLASTTEHKSIQDALDDVNRPMRPVAAATGRRQQLFYACIIALGLLSGALQRNVVLIVGAALLSATLALILASNQITRTPKAIQYLTLDGPGDTAQTHAEA